MLRFWAGGGGECPGTQVCQWWGKGGGGASREYRQLLGHAGYSSSELQLLHVDKAQWDTKENHEANKRTKVNDFI